MTYRSFALVDLSILSILGWLYALRYDLEACTGQAAGMSQQSTSHSHNGVPFTTFPGCINRIPTQMAQYLFARTHTCFTRGPEVTLTLEKAACPTELAKTDAGLQTRDMDTIQTQEIA